MPISIDTRGGNIVCVLILFLTFIKKLNFYLYINQIFDDKIFLKIFLKKREYNSLGYRKLSRTR